MGKGDGFRGVCKPQVVCLVFAHKGDQNQIGEVRARTGGVGGTQSGWYGAHGGAMALMVGMSGHATLPDDVPTSSFGNGREGRVLRHGQAL